MGSVKVQLCHSSIGGIETALRTLRTKNNQQTHWVSFPIHV